MGSIPNKQVKIKYIFKKTATDFSVAVLNSLSYYTASFNTFGKLPGKETKLWLTIFLTTQSGQTVEWHKDITDEFFDNPEHKIIIEDEIVVPDPPAGSGGGGFQPGVSEWEEEHHYIDL